MHEWGAELLRIGQQLKNEWGAAVQLMASVLIVAAAGWSLLKRIGRGILAAWRWARGMKAAEETESETPEGA